MEMGAKHVIVSMADQGAVLVSEQGAFAARIPHSKAVNSIGAGDSMVAGFLYAHIQGWNAQEAFRFAVAAGSTTALSEGFCNHEKIASFLPNVSISIIE
jgi:1-phosphofructokinase